jgi:hypothetical protein
MLATTTTKLAEFQTLRRRLFVLRRRVIATLTFRALQYDIIARHISPLELFFL